MIECTDCGLVQEAPVLAPGQWAACARCERRLTIARASGSQTTLALSLAALICLLMANLLPFLEFAYRGRRIESRLWTGIELLWQSGFELLSMLVAITVIAAPLLLLVGLVSISFVLLINRPASWIGPVYRWVIWLRPWAMLEVFLLGVLVAVVKVGQLADIGLHDGFYLFLVVVPLLMVAFDALDPRTVWSAADAAAPPPPEPNETAGRPPIACPVCSLRTAALDEGSEAHLDCPRCGERLERRKRFALQRSTALLLAAAVLYVPANTLPVLRIDLMGREQADTILEGVRSLLAGGLWEVAALVFFASFLVPGLKILGLSHLVLTIRSPSAERATSRTRLYRVVEQIGRWSMIDVFMTAVLTGLVQLGAIATIVPGAGATCFAAVVVLTIYAADSFEPRAIWDRLEETDG